MFGLSSMYTDKNDKPKTFICECYGKALPNVNTTISMASILYIEQLYQLLCGLKSLKYHGSMTS